LENQRAHAPSILKRQQAGVDSKTAGDAYRNKRTVWEVATHPCADAHFATFPPKLIEPCILAGSAPGDAILDPFMGAGTTALVAKRLGRRAIGAELNSEYIDISAKRLGQPALFAPVERMVALEELVTA
jgi:DNA modification methylase